jgi:hypothetical protein
LQKRGHPHYEPQKNDIGVLYLNQSPDTQEDQEELQRESVAVLAGGDTPELTPGQPVLIVGSGLTEKNVSFEQGMKSAEVYVLSKDVCQQTFKVFQPNQALCIDGSRNVTADRGKLLFFQDV